MEDHQDLLENEDSLACLDGKVFQVRGALPEKSEL